MADHPVIDRAVLRELQANAGTEFVAELIDTFLEEAPGMLAALRRAQAAGDADAFRRAAHSLKSNGLTFGAIELADAARALELGGIGSTAAIDALAADHARAAAALKELRDGA
jgi:HPt (histidine-containing phosphotransfer) domain-containing protein